MIAISILALLFAAVLTSITFAANRVDDRKARAASAQREALRDHLLRVGRDWSGIARHINRRVA
jgi:type II secretory pathway pseudopilin PulG